MRLLAVVLAARIEQPEDTIAGILAHLKGLEGRTRDRIQKVGDEMQELKAEKPFAQKPMSFLEMGEVSDQFDALADRAQLSVSRLQSTLEGPPPLEKELQSVEAETSAQVSQILEKAKAALPSSFLETDPTPAQALDAFSKKLQALEDKTKAEIQKAGWKPASFLEEEVKALGGTDSKAAKAAARKAQRAADKAKIESIFGDTLSMLKKETQDGAEQLVQLHQKAINAGRAQEGEWNPFDKADQDFSAADASSFLETGKQQVPTFDDINAEIRRIESDTQRQFGQFGSSFAQTASGRELVAKQHAHALGQLEHKLDKAWAAANATLEHFAEAATGKPYEPKEPAYQKLHEEFQNMHAKFAALKERVNEGTNAFLLATKTFHPDPKSSLLQEADAPSFAGLRKALMFAQRLALSRALAARNEQSEEKDWAAYAILGLKQDATAKQVVEKYRAMLRDAQGYPDQRARVQHAYETIKHSKIFARAQRKARGAQHRLTQTQHQQALAVLGLGEAVEHEVQQRYRELRELEAQEDTHWHQKPRKHSAVQHAYHQLAQHHQYAQIPKKALAPRQVAPTPVEEARQMLGVTAQTPPKQIRQRFWALKEALLGKPVPTALKLKALHALDDAYHAIKQDHPRLAEVTPAGQLRTH